MSLAHWWRSRFGTAASASPVDHLALARALAREGRKAEASEHYFEIRRKDERAEWLVEHAELLLELGNHYTAASQAARALQLEPGNPRALRVQRTIIALEDQPQRAH